MNLLSRITGFFPVKSFRKRKDAYPLPDDDLRLPDDDHCLLDDDHYLLNDLSFIERVIQISQLNMLSSGCYSASLIRAKSTFATLRGNNICSGKAFFQIK